MGGLTIVSPVPFFAARELLEPLTAGKPRMREVSVWQLARAETTGFGFDGALKAILGLYPLDAGGWECFFATSGPEVMRQAVPILRWARLILRDKAHSDAQPVVAQIATASGRRLARLAGFEPYPSGGPDRGDHYPGFERWEFADGKSGEGRRRSFQRR